MKNPNRQRGQTLLIIVLVLAVALTIGLAVVSRSVTDIRISRQEEESARVFSAAEAGIEEALKRNLDLGTPLSGNIGDISYQVGVTSLSVGAEFVFPEKIEANDVQTVWLVDHNNDGSLNLLGSHYDHNEIQVYWGDEITYPSEASKPALEVSLYYKDGSNYKLNRYAFDPNSIRAAEKGFDSPTGSAGYDLAGKRLQFYKSITGLPSGPSIIPYFLRLRLLYNTTTHLLGVKFLGSYYPSQGKCYESTAVLQGSGTTSTTQECLFYKAPPGIFDYVLFSGGDLIHQQ